MLNKLETTRQCLELAAETLRQVNGEADAVESIIIIDLIRETAELEAKINNLISAIKNTLQS